MNAVIGETLASWRNFSRAQKIMAVAINTATLSRPLIAGIVAYRGRDPERDWTWTDTGLIAAAALTDLDGKATNATGTCTKFGEVADPASDKVATAIEEASLVYRGEESAIRMGVRFGRDISISGLRAMVVKRTNGEGSVKANWTGKANTVLRMTSDTFAISPLGNRYPQVREGLQRASTATTVLSGLYNAVDLLKR